MRPLSLVGLLVLSASCTVRAPGPQGLGIQVDAKMRAEAKMRARSHVRTGAEVRVEAEARSAVEVHVEGEGAAGAEVVVEAEPPALVPIEGADVVEFFGIPLDGAQDVVFVLDRSGSMSLAAQGTLAQIGASGAAAPAGGEEAPAPAPRRKIDVAQDELVHALEQLPEGTRMNIVFFNQSVEGFAPGLAPLAEPGRESLIGYVRETYPRGSTALAPALRLAYLMNARRIVLLSDGLGNVGGDSRDILRDAREAMRGGVRIDTIGIGNDQDAALLELLALESGGLYQSL